jgi:hypothetical protein
MRRQHTSLLRSIKKARFKSGPSQKYQAQRAYAFFCFFFFFFIGMVLFSSLSARRAKVPQSAASLLM